MAQTMAEYVFEQGERRGKLLARRENVLKLLEIRFNEVPESVSKKIRSMRSLSRLKKIFTQAATAKTLDEIEMN